MTYCKMVFGVFLCALLHFKLPAQVSKIYDFTGLPNGKIPFGTLLPIQNELFGYAGGGSANQGILYKINSMGGGFTKIYDFLGPPSDGSPSTSYNHKLVFDGTYLYGVTSNGGTNYSGTIFKIKPDGTNYSVMYNFDLGINGRIPKGSLTLVGDFLFGTTSIGGNSDGFGGGTIFKISKNDNSFSTVHRFSGFPTAGGSPEGSLILIGDTLFGTTWRGGTQDKGTIFRINTNGTGFSSIINFNGVGNGENPTSDLASDGSFLYGITSNGGPNNNQGLVFKMKTNGTDFNILNADDSNGFFDNSPVLDAGVLYFINGYGLYSLATSPGPANLIHQFTLNPTAGNSPTGRLTKIGQNWFGVSISGGQFNEGTVFKYTPQQNVLASFGYSPQNPTINTQIQFSDQSTGQPNQWVWNFGDGSPISNIQNPVHTYSNSGTYTVTLTVTNPAGSNTTNQNIFVSSAPVVCDTLNYPLNGSLIAYKAFGNGIYAGYVTGNNYWGDKAKANLFSPIPTTSRVKGLYFLLPYKYGNSSCTAAIWSNSGSNGSPSSSPIATKVLNLSSITTSFNTFTYVEFANPVTVNGPFYAGLILPTPASDTVVIASNTDGSTNPGTAWELWSDGTWAPIFAANSFGYDISLAVFPRICPSSPTDVLDNINGDEFKIFPNPNTGLFHLWFDGNKEKVQVDVRSISGKRMKSLSFEENAFLNDMVNIDLSEISEGVYFLYVTQGKRLGIKKIIKLK